MTKLFVARIAALSMLVINIILIGLMVFHKPHRGGSPREMIIEKLDFGTDQISAYDELIKNHRLQLGDVEKEINLLKNVLYSSLIETDNPGTKDSLFAVLGSMQSEVEHIHYSHFEEIKSLCKPDQIPAFNAMTKELSSYFSPPKPMKK